MGGALPGLGMVVAVIYAWALKPTRKKQRKGLE
jgi:hypothetical protein